MRPDFCAACLHEVRDHLEDGHCHVSVGRPECEGPRWARRRVWVWEHCSCPGLVEEVHDAPVL